MEILTQLSYNDHVAFSKQTKESEMKNMFNWKDLLLVLVAVFIGGAGWTQDSQAVVITAIAIGVTWLLGWLLKKFNYKPGKLILTAFLFVIALGLSVLFQPFAVPAFPALGEDFAAWVPLFIAYLGAWVTLAGPTVSNATLIYNILLAKVLEKMSIGLTALISPPAPSKAARKR